MLVKRIHHKCDISFSRTNSIPTSQLMVIHLATCLLIGSPPRPSLPHFKAFVESAYGLPVVIGSHPIPQKYMDRHEKLPFWQDNKISEMAKPLLDEAREIKVA